MTFSHTTSRRGQPRADRREPHSTVQEVADLLDRYPNLSEIELARLINLYRGLSALDMALMISDPQLAPSLDRFSSDHRRQLRTPFRQYATLVVIAVAGFALAIWGGTRGIL